jgi:hypothetical protein
MRRRERGSKRGRTLAPVVNQDTEKRKEGHGGGGGGMARGNIGSRVTPGKVSWKERRHGEGKTGMGMKGIMKKTI